jgi:hypothetical protein
VPPRSGGLEGDLQGSQRALEVSFEAAVAAPQDEDEGWKGGSQNIPREIPTPAYE